MFTFISFFKALENYLQGVTAMKSIIFHMLRQDMGKWNVMGKKILFDLMNLQMVTTTHC
jgi:hypothetical protein